jgi:hypothetical protein
MKKIIFLKGIFFFLFLFLDRVLLCSPGLSGTEYIDQAGLKLAAILLPLPQERITGVYHLSK